MNLQFFPHIDSECLVEEASTLYAQIRTNQPGALARVRRSLGDLGSVDIIDFMFALETVAKEHGFVDWDTSREYDGNWRWAAIGHARWPTLRFMTSQSSPDQDQPNRNNADVAPLGERLATLDASVNVSEIVAKGVNEPLAPLGVAPLVYVCCSSFGANDRHLRDQRRAWVDELLANGADPNAGMREHDTIRGFRTCLGGAIGCARDVELARKLLNAGAAIDDGPTLYEGSAMWEAVRLCDHEALGLLIEAKPPEWHLCHALTHCLQFHDAGLVEQLLEAGADANWSMTVFGMGGNALHEAIQCDSPQSIIEQLVDGGANLDATDAGGRSPIAIATARGRSDLIAKFLRPGASTTEIRDYERFVGACFLEDSARAIDLVQAGSDVKATAYHDHLWLHEAVMNGSRQTFDMLLNIQELDVDVVDYRGQSPLHLAVALGDSYVVERLLQTNASTDIENFDGETAVELALRLAPGRDGRIFEMLVSHASPDRLDQRGSRLLPQDVQAFEAAVDAVAAGDIAKLRELLDRYPYFSKARAIRPHHCTLMNYVGVNGFEGERQVSPPNAVEVIELLLERGCDPNALCYTYRGGPGESTLGLLLSSGVVESAAQQTAMARALVRGGATIDAPHQAMFKLLDAQAANGIAEAVAELDVEGESIKSAFLLLSNQREFALMQALLDAGMDVNTANGLRQTAAHWAAYNNDEELVDWLRARGANLALREDQFGGNVAGWADAGGHAELAAKLAKLIAADS